MKGPGMGLCASWADVEDANGLRGHRDTAGLREALGRRLAWMGPDARQAVESAMEAIEEWR